MASMLHKPPPSEPHHGTVENISTGVPLTTLSTEDVHLLERYQSLARASSSPRSASRSTAGSLPRTPDLNGDEDRSKLRGVQSREWISLRSGTPSMRDQTPPPPPPKEKRTARSPLSKQSPWAARRSIRLVESFEEVESTTGLFEPMPLELDLSPLDLQFGALVMDVQDGTRNAAEDKGLPSKPKLVHFATTPSRNRHNLERQLQAPFEPEEDRHQMKNLSRRNVTPSRPAPAPPRPRTITPIRNTPRSPASPHASPRKLTSSWTHEIRSSIYRDLTPAEPSPARRRTRPDPALFPGVIPWKASPRDVGMRRQEKEWRRLQMGDGETQSSRTKKGFSWSGRERARSVELWRASAGSEDEAERVEDGWEVLR